MSMPLLMELPTRSEEREALAEAIAAYNNANAYHDKVAVALEQKEEQIRIGYHALDAAEAEVARAKANAGQRLVAALVHGTDEQEMSVESAEANLSQIKKDLTQVRSHSDTLSEELKKASQSIGHARRKLHEALRTVVVVEGGVLELKRRFDSVCAEAKALQQALSLVSFALPTNHLGQVILGFSTEVVQSPLEDAWKQALQALESDADAPLPEIPD
jgi:chromosome segregation ATPase